ncbi:MAG: ATP-binding protein, partial [Bacteroidota bacterium]
SNAIKYSPDGGDVYIQVDHFQQNNETLRIQIKDTGQGIAPDVLPYIFDRFYQVEDLATQKPQGSGVGLALTKELVQLLNGTIEVESKVQKGTSFILHFPVTREAGIKELDISTALEQSKEELIAAYGLIKTLTKEEILPPLTTIDQAIAKPTKHTPTLLIVEDNEDVQIYLQSCLEARYQLSFAKNGQAGIDLALAEVPDLMISDVMMPVKNGFELCDTLKNDERTSHIPIIMLTAKADFESKMEGFRSRADAYLTKPFNQEELLLRLNNLLEIRKELQLKYSTSSLQITTKPAPGKENITDKEDVFLQKLRQLIVDHIDRPELTADFISQQMGMSYTNIYRKLKALTNLSLVHFIRQIRMERSKELLLDPNLNIAEVAYAVGFADPNYFSRIFSDSYQQTPSQYRKNHLFSIN